jgi:SSS family solute:Na+ symporter
MDLLTIGDYYRRRYNKPVEVITGLIITVSYLGWTSAQFTALGLAFSVLSGGAISLSAGILLGATIVLGYTIWGGMWSVAFTDLFQSVMIIIGLWAIAWLVSDMAGGTGKVIAAASEAGKFEFWPKGDTREWLAFVAAWMTLAIGSIPQQDVFQRVTSAKDEKTAVRGTMIGALVYFAMALVPMFIAYSALVVDPGMQQLFAAEDEREIQRILPDLILAKMPLWAQIMFFGALLSAILSTSAGALLAPTALCTENVLRPFIRHMSDRQFLILLRVVLVSFTLAALLFALNSRSTMYEMVQNAYTVTLVGAFVPLVFGIFWKRANTAGAIMAIFMGIISWGAMELWGGDSMWPPQIVGLAFAVAGMLLGSLLTRAPHSHAHAGDSQPAPHGHH